MTESEITDRQLFEIVREADPLPAFGGTTADDGAELLRRVLSTPPRPRMGARSHRPLSLRPRPRHTLLAVVAAAAIAVPVAAFADDIGRLLGLSNQGTPVATNTFLSEDTGLSHAMQELGFPSTLHLLGTRDGIDFYAARKKDGHFCFAVNSTAGREAGCTVGDNAFPSQKEPMLMLPGSGRFAGFAADSVASVALVDASGNTLASAAVRDNLFAGPEITRDTISETAAVESLDANGNVLSTHRARLVAAGDSESAPAP